MSKLHIDVMIDVYSLEGPTEANVRETLHLELPGLASKYIQFPKIFEGVIEQTVERHNNRMTAWETRQAKEEAERRARPMLWDDNPTEDDRGADAAGIFTATGPDAQPITEEDCLISPYGAQFIAAYPLIHNLRLADQEREEIDATIAESVASGTAKDAEADHVEPA